MNKVLIVDGMTGSQILDKVNGIIARQLYEFDIICANPDATYNDVYAITKDEHESSMLQSKLSNLQNTCRTDELDELMDKLREINNEFSYKIMTSKKYYEMLKRIRERDLNQLTEEQLKTIDRSIENLERSGIHYDQDLQLELKQNSLAYSNVSNKYVSNCSNHLASWVHYVTEDELAGVSESIKDSLKQKSIELGEPDKYAITMLNSFEYNKVLTTADSRKLREFLYKEMINKNTHGEHDNTSLKFDITSLNYKQSKLHGYASVSDISLRDMMNKTSSEIKTLVTEVAEKAKPGYQRDKEMLLSYAKKHGYQGHTLAPWDSSYYAEKQFKELYGFNSEELKKYFKLENVVTRLFKDLDTHFNIEIEVSDPSPDMDKWHEDVVVYKMVDRDSGNYGYLYYDPFERAGKGAGAWMDPILNRCTVDGNVHQPIATVVTNFSNDKHHTLSIRDITTIYHEFGHAIHHLLSKVDSPAFVGLHGVPWDAVELPSQFMEEFTNNPDYLVEISEHIDDGSKLTFEMAKKVIDSASYGASAALLSQCRLTLVDLMIHDGSVDLNDREYDVKVWNSVTDQLGLDRYTDYSHNTLNSFTHIFGGGYDSKYYSYLWSEILSTNFFSVASKDKSKMREYKDRFLCRGGLVDYSTEAKDFVGGEYSIECLLKARAIV